MAVECARATVGAFTAVGYRGAPAAT
jgi:hypothetical protein